MKLFKRSMAASDAYFVQLNQAVWTKWNVAKMVKDGYQANSWVYRAISIIAQNFSSVPWVVMNAEGEYLWEHPISILMSRPNQHFTRQKTMELLAAWVLLSGTGYLKKVLVGQNTKELWPVSPDRLAPIPSADPAKFINGYMTIQAGGKQIQDEDYNADTVIQLKLTDPSNPWLGLSPLGAAARAVDLDNTQQEWNVSAMQNRGVVDGVFTFKRQLDPTQAQSIVDRIKEKFSGKENARGPMVVGDDATYHRLSLTPVEMDFLASRKANRDEIFAIFGIPPQLGGSQDAMTYDNFAASLRILWEATIIPLLDNFKDTLNHSFQGELSEGLYLTYDTSGVSALRDTDDEKAVVVEKYYKMGVPMSQLNEKYELGFEEYKGWDKSNPSTAVKQPTGEGELQARNRYELIPTEKRSIESEMKTRDDLAEGPVTNLFAAALEETQTAVFNALDRGDNNVAETVKGMRSEWRKAIASAYRLVMQEFIPTVATRNGEMGWEVRADPAVDAAIDQVLEQEAVILKELSLIEAATIKKILAQVQYGVDAGSSVAKIKQAIMDTGIFTPQRALTIARTISGAAASMGQMTGAQMSGAKIKEWLTSKAHVREWHSVREGEKVAIDKRFSSQRGGLGPRYPCDGDVAAEDRINCRCFMAFSRA